MLPPPTPAPQGVIEHITINNFPVGRNVDEALRTLQVGGPAGVLLAHSLPCPAVRGPARCDALPLVPLPTLPALEQRMPSPPPPPWTLLAAGGAVCGRAWRGVPGGLEAGRPYHGGRPREVAGVLCHRGGGRAGGAAALVAGARPGQGRARSQRLVSAAVRALPRRPWGGKLQGSIWQPKCQGPALDRPAPGTLPPSRLQEEEEFGAKLTKVHDKKDLDALVGSGKKVQHVGGRLGVGSLVTRTHVCASSPCSTPSIRCCRALGAARWTIC